MEENELLPPPPKKQATEEVSHDELLPPPPQKKSPVQNGSSQPVKQQYQPSKASFLSDDAQNALSDPSGFAGVSQDEAPVKDADYFRQKQKELNAAYGVSSDMYMNKHVGGTTANGEVGDMAHQQKIQATDEQKAINLITAVRNNPLASKISDKITEGNQYINTVAKDAGIQQLNQLHNQLQSAKSSGQTWDEDNIQKQIDAISAQPYVNSDEQTVQNEFNAWAQKNAPDTTIPPAVEAMQKAAIKQRIADFNRQHGIKEGTTIGDVFNQTIEKDKQLNTDKNNLHDLYDASNHAIADVRRKAGFDVSKDENGNEAHLMGAGESFVHGVNQTATSIANGLASVGMDDDEKIRAINDDIARKQALYPTKPETPTGELTQVAGSVVPYFAAGPLGGESAIANAIISGASFGADAKWNSLVESYQEQKQNDPSISDHDALQIAKSQSNFDAAKGFVVGGSLPFGGAAGEGMVKAAVGKGTLNVLENYAAKVGVDVSLFGGSRLASNLYANSNGAKRDLSSGVADQVKMAVLFGTLHTVRDEMPAHIKNVYDAGMAKILPDFQINLDNLVNTGVIPQAEANKIIEPALRAKQVLDVMPNGLGVVKEQKIMPLMREKLSLIGKKKTLDKSFHEPIDRKIEGIDEDIKAIMAGRGNDEKIADSNARIAEDIKAGDVKDEDLLHYADHKDEIDKSISSPEPEQDKTESRVVAPKISERQSAINGLLDMQDKYNDMSDGARGKSSADGQGLRGQIKDKIAELGLTMRENGKAITVRSAKDRPVKRNMSAEGNKGIADEHTPLDKRGEDVRGTFNLLGDIGPHAFPEIEGMDGKRMSQRQIQAAINDVKSGNPTNGAERLLNTLEDAHKDGNIDMIDPDSRETVSIPVKEYLDTIKEAYHGTDEHLNKLHKLADDWFDSLTPEQKTTLTDGQEQGEVEQDAQGGEGGNVPEINPDKEAQQTKGTTEPPAEGESGVKQPPSYTSLKNEKVDSEREARGLSPAIQEARKTFGASWDEAMGILDENPAATDELINGIGKIKGIKEKPRPLSDVENALLLHRQIELQNDYAKQNEAVNKAAESGDEAALAEARTRLAGTSDALQEVYDIGKRSGTENARGLAIRRALAKEDYSLAAMETQKRAAQGGKPLSPEVKAEIEALHNRINETQKAFENYVANHEKIRAESDAEGELKTQRRARNKVDKDKILTQRTKIVADIKDKGAAILHKLAEKSGGVKNIAATNEESLTTLLKEIAPDIADLAKNYAQEGVVNLNDIVDKIHDEIGDALGLSKRNVRDAISGYGIEKEKSTRSDLQKELDKLKSEARSLSKGEDIRSGKIEDPKVKAYKKRTAKRIAEVEDKLKRGDFAKTERRPIGLDKEGLALKAEYERAKQEFDLGLEKDRLKNRSGYDKTLDAIVKWGRAAKLSSPITLAKLTSAAIIRMTVTPVEEIVGAGISKLIPKIAKQALREGGFNSKAEAKALTDGVIKGLADAAKSIAIKKGGKSDIEVLLGEKHLPPEAIDFFGHLHSALKAPAKRAEFERSLQKRLDANIANGVDVHDPVVQTSILADAYKDANRAIFMQDNFVSDQYRNLIRSMETSKKNPKVGKLSAAVLQELMPFVKVPTNVIGETFTYALGLPKGLFDVGRIRSSAKLKEFGAEKLASVFHEGMGDLTNDQADMVLRTLKKGSIGAAFLLLGYFNPTKVGGYRSKKKENESEVDEGELKIGDTAIPKFLLHNPLMEALQIGATMRQVVDHYEDDEHPVAQGTWASAMGLVSQTPMIDQAGRMDKLAKHPIDYAGDFTKGATVPALLDFIARQTDRDADGNKVSRKPDTFFEHIESGIPGLRQTIGDNEDEGQQKLQP